MSTKYVIKAYSYNGEVLEWEEPNKRKLKELVERILNIYNVKSYTIEKVKLIRDIHLYNDDEEV